VTHAKWTTTGTEQGAFNPASYTNLGAVKHANRPVCEMDIGDICRLKLGHLFCFI